MVTEIAKRYGKKINPLLARIFSLGHSFIAVRFVRRGLIAGFLLIGFSIFYHGGIQRPQGAQRDRTLSRHVTQLEINSDDSYPQERQSPAIDERTLELERLRAQNEQLRDALAIKAPPTAPTDTPAEAVRDGLRLDRALNPIPLRTQTQRMFESLASQQGNAPTPQYFTQLEEARNRATRSAEDKKYEDDAMAAIANTAPNSPERAAVLQASIQAFGGGRASAVEARSNQAARQQERDRLVARSVMASRLQSAVGELPEEHRQRLMPEEFRSTEKPTLPR